MSRGFVFFAALLYVLMIYPRIKFVLEEFGGSPSPLFLLIKSIFSAWFLVVPVAFLMLILNSVILGLISHRDKELRNVLERCGKCFCSPLLAC